MSSGYHDKAIPKSLEDADSVFIFKKSGSNKKYCSKVINSRLVQEQENS